MCTPQSQHLRGVTRGMHVAVVVTLVSNTRALVTTLVLSLTACDGHVDSIDPDPDPDSAIAPAPAPASAPDAAVAPAPAPDAAVAPIPAPALDAAVDAGAEPEPEPDTDSDFVDPTPALPICDCFVRVSWCGASAGRHALGLDAPCRIPLLPDHDGDILGCTAAGEWTVLEACDLGCAEMPTGTPDSCVSDRTPEDPGWPDCEHRALLHSGLHPEASDRLRCAGVSADRISQTIGTAAASAGYHASDGTADGHAYTAAVDLRTRDLSTTEVRALLERLGRNGFAAWYRDPGSDGWPSDEAPHIHAVFAGVVMKSQLREQVRDYLEGRNGLVSHTEYRFWRASAAIRETIRLLFERHYTP